LRQKIEIVLQKATNENVLHRILMKANIKFILNGTNNVNKKKNIAPETKIFILAEFYSSFYIN
jgi:hypothetical protein